MTTENILPAKTAKLGFKLEGGSSDDFTESGADLLTIHNQSQSPRECLNPVLNSNLTIIWIRTFFKGRGCRVQIK